MAGIDVREPVPSRSLMPSCIRRGLVVVRPEIRPCRPGSTAANGEKVFRLKAPQCETCCNWTRLLTSSQS